MRRRAASSWLSRGEDGVARLTPDPRVGLLQYEVAQVAVPLRAVWWQERGMSMQGSEHPWVFMVRAENDGWRIAEVRPHPWCGGHVRVDACQ